MTRFPFATLMIAGSSFLIWWGGDNWADLLEWRRSEIADGQWWRIATGHLCHWSGGHFFWDLLMFVAMGFFLEARSRKSLVWSIVLAVAFSHFALTQMSVFNTYRGLSGVGSAVFVCLALRVTLDARSRNDRIYGVLGLVGFTAKLAYEIAWTSPLFVQNLGRGVQVAICVHAAGFTAGLASAKKFALKPYTKCFYESQISSDRVAHSMNPRP